jgi:hypothetical protein
MKFEAGKFYKTRDGRKAEIRLDDVKTASYGESLLVRINDRDWLMYGDGKFYNSRTNHPYDLVEEWKEPHKIEGWVNLYKGGHIGNNIYKTKRDAKSASSILTITQIYISGVEGVEP